MAKGKNDQKKRFTERHTHSYRSSDTDSNNNDGWTQVLRKVSRSCSTSGTHRVTLDINSVISIEWRTDQEVLTICRPYSCSFVTHIFRNGFPSHRDDRKTFKVITTTQPIGTLGSVASFLTATFYQGNLNRNHILVISDQLRDINSHAGGAGKFTRENCNHLFLCKVSFCQFRDVGQCTKKT